MRKLLQLAICFVLFSCNANNYQGSLSIIKSNVEAYLKPNLNDPKSYEFDSLKVFDTITNLSLIRSSRESCMIDLKVDGSMMEDAIKNKKDYPDLYNYGTDYESKYKKEILIEIAKIKSLDSLQKSLGADSNKILAYLGAITYRAKNGMGALMLFINYFKISPEPEFKVIDYANDMDGIVNRLYEFPGTEAVQRKIKVITTLP